MAASPFLMSILWWTGEKFVYVLLNGENRPAIHPQPVVSAKSFRVPVVTQTDGKDKGDQMNDRCRHFVLETARHCHTNSVLLESQAVGDTSMDLIEAQFLQQEKVMDKSILGLLQEACRTQRTANALDLLTKLRAPTSLEAAVKIADHFGRSIVASRSKELQRLVASLNEKTMVDVDLNHHLSSGMSTLPHQTSDFDGPSSGGGGKSRAFQDQEQSTPNLSTSEVAVPLTKKSINPFKSALDSPSKKRKTIIETVSVLRNSPSPQKVLLVSWLIV